MGKRNFRKRIDPANNPLDVPKRYRGQHRIEKKDFGVEVAAFNIGFLVGEENGIDKGRRKGHQDGFVHGFQQASRLLYGALVGLSQKWTKDQRKLFNQATAQMHKQARTQAKGR